MTAAKQHVDYNQIAASYHRRYQRNRLEGVARALIDLARDHQAAQILEVGCGTGRWLESLAQGNVQATGLDLSLEMLKQTRLAGRCRQLACGQASHLPFRPQVFDLVFCVNALHHFEDPATFIAAAADALKTNGVLAIIGQVPQDRRNRWFVYDYFPGTYQTDLERFPAWETVMDWMQSVGFEQLQLEVVEEIHDPKLGAEVLQDPFLQKTATSQLALLSDHAYRQGMDRIRLAVERSAAEGNPLTFQVDLRLDMLYGRKQDR